MLTIVPLYGAILGLLMIALSVRVIRVRRSVRVALGTGANLDLQRAIRVQGNFAEYVPLALLLLAFVEFGGGPAWTVHSLCLLLLAGRLSHAFGVSHAHENFRYRVAGMTATFAVLAFASMVLLIGNVWPSVS